MSDVIIVCSDYAGFGKHSLIAEFSVCIRKELALIAEKLREDESMRVGRFENCMVKIYIDEITNGRFCMNFFDNVMRKIEIGSQTVFCDFY